MDENERREAHSGRTGRGRADGAVRLLTVCAAMVAVPFAAPSSAQQSGASVTGFTPLITIKELMEKAITPATNTLWNAYEPPADDEQWVALEEAAVMLLAASNVNALGGTGPTDDQWAQEPAWKAFNQVMIRAGLDALAAIRARDHDALLEAGDVLYPPCEGCHQLYNPGVNPAAVNPAAVNPGDGTPAE